MNRLPDRPKNAYPAKVNVQSAVAAARKAGLPEKDIRKLLATGRFGRTVPDSEMREIGKGLKFERYIHLKKAIAQCDKKLAVKNLPDDIWVAISKAKAEYLAEMSQLTQELDEIGNKSPSAGNGQYSPHSFGPREQIGNVAAVQVTIGPAQQPAPVTDVSQVQSIPTPSSPGDE